MIIARDDQELARWSWPAQRLHEALALLAPRQRGGAMREVSAPRWPANVTHWQLNAWLDEVTAGFELDVEEVDAAYVEVDAWLANMAPALLEVTYHGEPRFLVVAASHARQLTLWLPDGSTRRVAREKIRGFVVQSVEQPARAKAAAMLTNIELTAAQRTNASAELMRQLLIDQRVGPCWMIRPAMTAAHRLRADEARIPRWLLITVVTQLLISSIFVVSWWLLGHMMLSGRMELGWLSAWGLSLLTLVPLRTMNSFAEGELSLAAGTLLKRDMLRGALRMDVDAVRRQGAGQLLGRVIEAEVVESTALSGGFLTLHGLVEAMLSVVILAWGAHSGVLASLLMSCLVVLSALAWRYYQCRQAWTTARLKMTGELGEKLAGHRTRLAQQPRRDWSDGEDATLEEYLRRSQSLDQQAVRLRVLVPRCWLIVAFVGLLPLFVAHAETPRLAIAVGAILWAYQALRQLTAGCEDAAAAWIAWRAVRPFWQAGRGTRQVGDANLAVHCQAEVDPSASASVHQPALIDARDIHFTYPQRQQPVLDRCNLQVNVRDRILLEGRSGAGKSTLAAILSGNREPSSGLLLMRGIDRGSLGSHAWRRQVVVAPQFHDNHLLSGTLAFNVLMGRNWPPSHEDLQEAERVLRGLQLGDLLDRMPSGLFQTVGETGWQLSHGERSRVFAARVLLQRSQLLILDESFAALDPETLATTMEFVLAEAPALMVIAHP